MVLHSRYWSARSSFLSLENYFHPASSILRPALFHFTGRFLDRRVPIPLKDFFSPWFYFILSLSLISFFPSVRRQAKWISSVHRANPCECCNPFNPAVTSRINEQQGLLSFLGYYLREWLPPSDSETDFFSSPSTSPLSLLTEEKNQPFRGPRAVSLWVLLRRNIYERSRTPWAWVHSDVATSLRDPKNQRSNGAQSVSSILI